MLSFEYLTFETDSEGHVVFELFADGMRLVLEPAEDEEGAEPANPRAARLIESEAYDPDVYAMLDDDDEEESR